MRGCPETRKHAAAAGCSCSSWREPADPPIPPTASTEAFEAVWGALYEDAGFQLAPVKETYARLFPVEGSGVLAGVEAALPTSMPAGANGSGLDA